MQFLPYKYVLANILTNESIGGISLLFTSLPAWFMNHGSGGDERLRISVKKGRRLTVRYSYEILISYGCNVMSIKGRVYQIFIFWLNVIFIDG